MRSFDSGKRRICLFLAAIGIVVLLANLSLLSGTDMRSKIKNILIQILIPGNSKSGLTTPPDPNVSPPDTLAGPITDKCFQLPKLQSWYEDHGNFEEFAKIDDLHPIAGLMSEADQVWEAYEEGRSQTFKETVAKYRRKYGRHPPPRFRDWYRFARDNNVHNVDDFDQIMDDLRPFWGIEPAIIRSYAAHMHEVSGDGISGLHIRDQKIWKLTNDNWRVQTFAEMVKDFVKYLPDMDIAMNRLDQPRVVVPWDDMQALLGKEAANRQVYPDATAEWTKDMAGLYKENDTDPVITDAGWFRASGQQYMLIGKEACPPESHARNPQSPLSSVEAVYKNPQGGFITNFNRSSDLCTIGPEIENKHGFLFAASTVIASKKLLPVFGECKVNVNSDILFPANMYYQQDERYAYDSTYDYDWDDKDDTLIWRGVTSGGTSTADNWMNFHRQRFVLLTNGTVMADKEVRVLSETISRKGDYVNFDHFCPKDFANKHTDVGFTESWACIPDCSYYDEVWTYKNMTSMSKQFESKYVVDVDGHSFSGRWHAFLQSKSLGIKATIFREWHDSRLIPWRHFVPLDNRYDELYAILTYFIGLGSQTEPPKAEVPYIARHDFEARKLGRQGREWAAKVLRREDLQVILKVRFQSDDVNLLADIYVPSAARVCTHY